MSLIDSVSWNDLSEVKRLLAIGTDINAVDDEGCTALWWAASKGYVECVVALLDANADVDKFSENRYSPLLAASSIGHTECVRLLLQHKADIRILNKYGYSALHYASANGHLTCVNLLVAAGASQAIDISDNAGATPLAFAIKYNRADIAKFLLHSGAKMKNVPPHIKITDWMHQLITERCNVMISVLVLIGALKRRCGLSKDATHLIALYVWSRRLKYKK
jgi:ankyrin repeat protein